MKTKAQIDQEIYTAVVVKGQKKSEVAKQFGTSPRSVGRAIERFQKVSKIAPTSKKEAPTQQADITVKMKNGTEVKVKKVDNKELKIGHMVVLSSQSRYTDSTCYSVAYNPTDVVGVISEITGVIIGVDWYALESTRHNYNVYSINTQSLLKVVSISDPAKKEEAPAKPVKGQVSGVLQALEKGQEVEFISTSSSVILALDGESEIVEETHPNFKAIQIAIVNAEYSKAFDLMNIRKSIESFTRGSIKISGEKMFYGQMEIKSSIAHRIMELMRQGDEGYVKLVNFFEKLMENPSRESVEQLWGFVSHNDIDIDSEGYIIGWKKVNRKEGGLFDNRTQKVSNNIGNVVSMPRWMVDANKKVTCSQGLHIGAWDYVKCFMGDTIIKVRVNPRDVVSVPDDYNDMKMRACRYEVVAIVDSSRKEIETPENLAKAEPQNVVVGSFGELLSSSPL